jgi:hypothetical protein
MDTALLFGHSLSTLFGSLVTSQLLALPGVSQGFPWAFVAVYVVGFIAAVSIGSIAWYNSKRPAGWEGRDRPDFVPDLKPTDAEGTTNSQDSSTAE